MALTNKEEDAVIEVEIDFDNYELRELIVLMEGLRALFFRAVMASDQPQSSDSETLTRLQESYIDFAIQNYGMRYPDREFMYARRPYAYLYDDRTFAAWLRTVEDVDVDIVGLSSGSIVLRMVLRKFFAMKDKLPDLASLRKMTTSACSTIADWARRPAPPNVLDRMPSVLSEIRKDHRIKKFRVRTKDGEEVDIDFTDN